MGVSADQGVRVVDAVLLVHATGQVFQVDLVHDAEARLHHAEGIERLHAPLHELVALVVALEFQLHVQVQRLLFAEMVDLHRVVDHQVHRHQWLDLLGVLAHLLGDVAHRGQVGQQRHAGKVLQDHTGHHEGNFVGALGVRLPVGKLPDVLFGDLLAVAVSQHRFQHHADRHRQSPDCHVQLLAQLGQGVILALAGRADLEFF
ncbi:hypothetical protein D9M72_395120 [compost metagenome]